MSNQIRKIIVEELKDAYVRNSKTIAYHKPNYILLESFHRLLLLYMTPKEYKDFRENIFVGTE